MSEYVEVELNRSNVKTYTLAFIILSDNLFASEPVCCFSLELVYQLHHCLECQQVKWTGSEEVIRPR